MSGVAVVGARTARRRHTRPAVAAHGRKAHVIEHDVDNVGCAVGCSWWFERRPVRFRVADVDIDRALERLVHLAAPRAPAGHLNSSHHKSDLPGSAVACGPKDPRHDAGSGPSAGHHPSWMSRQLSIITGDPEFAAELVP